MITIAQAVAVIGPVNNEPLLQRLIESATGTLGRTLLRYLGPPLQRTEVRDGTGGYSIWLREDPTPDSVVSVRTRPDIFQPWTDLANPDPDTGQVVYALDGRRLDSRSGWPVGRSTVEITYTAGFGADEGPVELQELVLQMVADRWASLPTQGGVGGIKSETIGDYSYTNFTAAEIAGIAGGLGLDWEKFARQWKRHLI